jgi:hypothetical protein
LNSLPTWDNVPTTRGRRDSLVLLELARVKSLRAFRDVETSVTSTPPPYPHPDHPLCLKSKHQFLSYNNRLLDFSPGRKPLLVVGKAKKKTKDKKQNGK